MQQPIKNIEWYLAICVQSILSEAISCTVKPVFKGHLNIPEKVALHGRCPFVTGSLAWGRYNTVMRKCPLITGCPLVAVSIEDRFYCSMILDVSPSSYDTWCFTQLLWYLMFHPALVILDVSPSSYNTWCFHILWYFMFSPDTWCFHLHVLW